MYCLCCADTTPAVSVVLYYLITAGLLSTAFISGALTISSAILAAVGALSNRETESIGIDPSRNLLVRSNLLEFCFVELQSHVGSDKDDPRSNYHYILEDPVRIFIVVKKVMINFLRRLHGSRSYRKLRNEGSDLETYSFPGRFQG